MNISLLARFLMLPLLTVSVTAQSTPRTVGEKHAKNLIRGRFIAQAHVFLQVAETWEEQIAAAIISEDDARWEEQNRGAAAKHAKPTKSQGGGYGIPTVHRRAQD